MKFGRFADAVYQLLTPLRAARGKAVSLRIILSDLSLMLYAEPLEDPSGRLNAVTSMSCYDFNGRLTTSGVGARGDATRRQTYTDPDGGPPTTRRRYSGGRVASRRLNLPNLRRERRQVFPD
ncbi:hypothetical protein EVAR_46428_1 [Eumeta japonica]|uniref:Uncharacterized protein n=1 Tax=Eumeta variegata TaxID=151549 RepID=A0A4C1XH86_EUMVA|nr:hypothetical protein EVAR_46428_1 [Eumeta japonica]